MGNPSESWKLALTTSDKIRFNGKVGEIKLQTVIQREIRNRNESLNSVAKACGMSVSVLHNWSQGIKPSAKNIHHLLSLADHFGISLSMLLFNKDDTSKSDTEVLFSSTFRDGKTTYRLVVEKMEG